MRPHREQCNSRPGHLVEHIVECSQSLLDGGFEIIGFEIIGIRENGTCRLRGAPPNRESLG